MMERTGRAPNAPLEIKFPFDCNTRSYLDSQKRIIARKKT